MIKKVENIKLKKVRRLADKVASNFETPRRLTYQQFVTQIGLGSLYGDDGRRDTPVPIPNTEVKPSNADGTRRETSLETRKFPNLLFCEDYFFTKFVRKF